LSYLEVFMTAVPTIAQSEIPDLPLLNRGKVRDVYEIDQKRLLLVATDRISAFDCVLRTLIPYKGEVLTRLSEFWFHKLSKITSNHLLSTDLDAMPDAVPRRDDLRGRSTLVRRTEVFPVECVVRGYLEGSAWKDYKATRMTSGHELPRNLVHCDRLLDPIFTPATKAVTGHDENITGLEFRSIVGAETAAYLKSKSLEMYKTAAAYALTKGIIVADTKFEFGRDDDGNILLIDEVLTPDSSRFWAADAYQPGHAQPSFDKQFVREYLETLDWDKQPPAPPLPPDVAEATSQRYIKALELLTGKGLSEPPA